MIVSFDTIIVNRLRVFCKSQIHAKACPATAVARVSASLPRPAPAGVGAGVGAAAAGKIKNPTSQIRAKARPATAVARARRSLTPPKHRSILQRMSTVQEIEAAADLLPVEQKEELLRFLAVRLRKERKQSQPRIYSNQEVATMLAEDEADGERFRKGR